ncbi:MAG: LptA/OstA family protein [Candidatus Omnitrophota bacterium]
MRIQKNFFSVMMKHIFLLCLLIAPFAAFSQESKEDVIPVVIDGDQISYGQEEGKAFAKGNVVMKSGDSELYCDSVEYDTDKNIAHAKGNVKVINGNSVIYGENVIYNFNTSNAEMVNIRFEEAPIFGESEQGEKIGKEKFILDRAYITTCDLEHPHWRLTAKRIFVYPGDKIVARNMILMIGDTPVFYLPKYSHSLKDNMPPIEFSAGKTKEWGTYMLSRYRYRLNDKSKGKIIYDYYYKRGKGFGLSNSTDTDFGSIFAKYYSIADVYYKLDSREDKLSGLPGSRVSPARIKYLEDDRYKAQIFYEWEPLEKLSIKSEFNKYSDEYIMEDFFAREHEASPTTSTYALATYSLSNASLSLHAKKRVNRFFAETEYLPQLEYSFYRQGLGESNFYFESTDKVGNIYSQAGYSREYDKTWRSYSHNVLSYANKIFKVSLDPYIGQYTMLYSRNPSGGFDMWRNALEAGSAASMKFYKIFDADWSFFGEKIDKMRHVLTPKIDYKYMHDPTVANGNVFQFDGDDSLSRQDSATFSLENKLQARNEERTWDFIYFSPSTVYTFNQEGSPNGAASYLTDINYTFEIYPKEETSLTLNSTYNIPTRRWGSISADLTITGMTKVFEGEEEVEKEKYVFCFGQRYTKQSSTQSTLDFTYHLSPKLQFRNYLRYEGITEDFEAQQYVLRTDMHCWWMDFGLDINRHERGGKDLSFWFAFTLKAFPDISFDFDQEYKGAKPSYAEYSLDQP